MPHSALLFSLLHGSIAVLEATYGPTGEVLTRATSLGHAEELVWSASGRLVERRVGGTAILRRELDERLRERSRELSGGGRIQTAFDAGGRLAAVRVSSPSGPSVERRMQHDARGALELVWDSRGRGARFEHDVEENLVRVTHEGGASFAYSFDEADNLYEQGDGREYEAGGRLVRYRGAAYSYNQDGKLIEKIGPDSSEAWRYEWTETGRLRAVVRPGGERIEYAYDCFGRRLQKRSSSGAVRYVWDGDDLLHEITSPAGPGQGRAIRTYLFAPEAWMPVAHRDGAPSDGSGDGWLHYVTDDAGAPALLVSADGARIEDVERSPWGRDRTGSPTPLGMLGQYMDEDTGLAYNRFRYYNPETGRYISPDPLAAHAIDRLDDQP
jgi:RHS repeat-associated protein